VKRFCCLLLAAAAFAAQSEAPDISGPQVIDHLNRTIAWYQHVSAADQSGNAPENVLLAESVHQSAKQVVRRAFAFARAQAAVLANQKGDGTPQTEQPRTLEQTAAAANERVQNLQKRIDDLNQQIAKASKRTINTLLAQRDMLNADLSFAKVAQSGITDMLKFASGAEKGSGLLGQINLLAGSDSMPAALSDTTPAANTAANTQSNNTKSQDHPETAGIAALLADTFRLLRERSQIDSLRDETRKLGDEIVQLRAPVRAKLRDLLKQSDTYANTALDQTDPAALNTQRQQLERMAARFKALASPILPLSEQGLALTATEGALSQWRDNTGQRLQTILGYLAFRLCTLLAGVVVLFIVSEVVRRATVRYVRDTRRRQQFVLIRRFIVAVIATIMVVIASLSGIGSFATIAGFVTAGLAVALQNVILSVVAYFFLIGRYGLRTGDRVTVSGITGEVIEVGLVRLYLMEFAGTGADLHSTGRVAVFSNSVIFQPSALIKQAPGTEYVWHGVAVTLAFEANLEQARERMLSAVESVYNTYKQVIQAQHAAFERAVNTQLPDASPTSRAHYTDSGIEVIVRYPVEIEDVSRVDEKVINAILQEIQKEPALKLAPSSYPRTLGTT
jgi:small-conductance mechanosensitive channel